MNWFKSSFSREESCVEVCLFEDRILVRNSKDPAGPVLSFTGDEWVAFLKGVQEDEFDL